jgi:hypothetical protein
MYQTVGHEAVAALASCLELPLYTGVLHGRSVARGRDYRPTAGDEVEDLDTLLARVQVLPVHCTVSSRGVLTLGPWACRRHTPPCVESRWAPSCPTISARASSTCACRLPRRLCVNLV